MAKAGGTVMKKLLFLLVGLLILLLIAGGVFYFMKRPKAGQVPQGYEKTPSLSRKGASHVLWR